MSGTNEPCCARLWMANRQVEWEVSPPFVTSKVVGPAAANVTMRSAMQAKPNITKADKHPIIPITTCNMHGLRSSASHARYLPRNCHSTMGLYRSTQNANLIRQSTPSNSLGSWVLISLQTLEDTRPESAKDKQTSTFRPPLSRLVARDNLSTMNFTRYQ